jgi:hypothetical protein
MGYPQIGKIGKIEAFGMLFDIILASENEILENGRDRNKQVIPRIFIFMPIWLFMAMQPMKVSPNISPKKLVTLWSEAKGKIMLR